MVASSTTVRMPGRSPAHQFSCLQRKELSLAVLSGIEPLSHLAAQHQVSRKFCYQQVDKAKEALDKAFAQEEADSQVLFHLPVTKAWIEQFVLAQALIGHSSDRGIQELLLCLLDYPHMSLGSIHNLLARAAQTAARINAGEKLDPIHVAAFDEIYQAGEPVLVGMDVKSTYCFLLEQEPCCDGTTWGVHLLELSELGGMSLHHSIADGGLGLRSGMAQAWPKVPCHGDIFHPLRDIAEVVQKLKRRAVKIDQAVAKCREKVDSCPPGWSRKLDGRRGGALVKLRIAQAEQERAWQLYRDVDLLEQWFRKDVLALAGDTLAIRRELYDFVMAELRVRERLCAHLLTPLRKTLSGQQDQLLGFAQVLEEELDEVAQHHQIAPQLVRALAKLQGMDPDALACWRERKKLAGQLGGRFFALEEEVKATLAQTTRASSMVENLNGRLRRYFSLRRQLGRPYLDLLRFFLNHRPYMRSVHPERVDKTPAQLLYGTEHPHWLAMLGYNPFERN
jgi:hypothetical protein